MTSLEYLDHIRYRQPYTIQILALLLIKIANALTFPYQILFTYLGVFVEKFLSRYGETRLGVIAFEGCDTCNNEYIVYPG